MAGPWEDYKQPESKPWEDYHPKASNTPQEPNREDFIRQYGSLDAPGMQEATKGNKFVESAKAGGVGAPALLGGEVIGKGVSNLGDYLMQRAVGFKNTVPGLGKILGQEGLIGTRGMMAKQVEQGLENRGAEIGNLAKTVDEVSTKPVAERLETRANKIMSNEGTVLPEDIPIYNKFKTAAGEATQDETISGEEAAFRRQRYGKIARDAGRYRDNPAQGMKAQLAGEQQAGYSQALKDAYAKQFPEDASKLADADRAYSTLAQANTQLSKNPSALSQILGFGARSGTGAAIGCVIGGKEGAKTGGLIGAAAGSPAVKSTAARIMMSPGTTKAIQVGVPETYVKLQELLNGKE